MRSLKALELVISDRDHRRLVIGMIILLGFILYVHTLPYPFVWDGRGYILGNPLIKGFDYYDDIFNFSTFAQLDEKLGIPEDFVTNFTLRPVTYLTFSINYLLGGSNPLGYRAINVGIHIFNAVITYLLLDKILRHIITSRPPDQFSMRFLPVATALFFLVHPLQTESVIYITQRFTSLATSFYLLTILLYLCSVTSNQPQSALLLRCVSITTVLIGMLTKEIVFTAPVILVVLEIIVLRTHWRTSLRKTLPHLFCLPVIPALVMFTSAAQDNSAVSIKSSINIINFYNLSGVDYAITQLCTLTAYLRLLLLPYGQNVDYDFPLYTSIFQGRVCLSIIIITAIIVLSFVSFRQTNLEPHGSLLFLGAVFFFITISITSSIIPMADLIAERRTYLPSVGFFLFLACTLDLIRLKMRSIVSAKLLVVILATWLIILCVATYARSGVWRSRISFWQDAALKSPGKLRPMMGLVAAHLEQKQIELALEWQKKIVAQYPDDPNHLLILEELFYLQGHYTDAIETGVHVLSLGSSNERVYFFLGQSYAKIGMQNDAEQAFKYAIALQPNSIKSHLALAELLISGGNYKEAEKLFEKILKIYPQNKTLQQRVRALEDRFVSNKLKSPQ